MKFRIIVFLLLAGWGAAVFSPAFAASSSSSYKITAQVLDSGGKSAASASFKLLGKTRAHQLRSISTTSYILGEGFLRSAYFTPPVFAPIVTGIVPSSETNAGTVEITNLAGANFAAGASVKLSQSGQTDIAAINVVVASSSKITCAFDITDAESGLWDVTVTNSDGRSGSLPSAFTVNSAAPVVLSISPAKGYNNEIATINEIVGKHFRKGAGIKLSQTGQSDIAGESVDVKSATKISGKFNLNGKNIGLWDLVVTNPDAQSGTLANAFKVESTAVEVVGPLLNYPNPFNPASGPTTIKYTLSRDYDVIIYIYSMRGERVWQYIASSGSEGGKVGLNQVLWDGITAFRAGASSGVYLYHVTAKIDGQINILARGKMAVIR